MNRLSAFTLDRFERVDASAGTALMRLEGSWEGTPELIVDDGRRSHRIRALPAPAGGALAFPVPRELVDGGRVAFALDVGGTVADLPRPSARDAAAVEVPARPPAPPAPLPPEIRYAPDPEAEARRREQIARERTEWAREVNRLASERDDARGRLLRVERERDEAVTRVEALLREREDLRGAREAARADLERLTREHADATAARDAAQRALDDAVEGRRRATAELERRLDEEREERRGLQRLLAAPERDQEKPNAVALEAEPSKGSRGFLARLLGRG